MPSWQSAAVSLFTRLAVKPLAKRDASVAQLRAQVEGIERLFARTPAGFAVATKPTLPNCDAEWLSEKGARTDRTVLHFPGGAYILRMPGMERALLARICHESHAHGRLVFYRLAPEHPFPAGHDDCIAAYRQLLDRGVPPDRIVLSGFSAGGGMALAVLLALRDRRLPLPAGAVLMSPFADLTAPAEGSRVANRGRDPVLSHTRRENLLDIYAGGSAERLRHPYVSPVFGDYRGLPPLLFQVGSTEILLDDTRRCAERARAAGVAAEVEIWPQTPHGWQGFQTVPESQRAIEHIGDFVRSCCP